MSKGGGAGRVYFVLYLAVVLELLIIIVERDEAEEHLAKKQRESMRIVESILSQLQSGAGTEGINTRPQDEITIPPPGINLEEVLGTTLKSNRQYIVKVGVTDVSADLKRKEGESDKDYTLRLQKLVKLANVEQIEYQIFFNPSADIEGPPLFPSEDDLKKSNIELSKLSPGAYVDVPNGTGSAWEFMGSTELILDDEATFNLLNLKELTPDKIHPVYPMSKVRRVGQSFCPSGINPDSVFAYSIEATRKEGLDKKGGLTKRDFVINFQPNDRAGWYKLRFASRTNRILGISGGLTADQIPDDATVNIGTVQLSVRDLRSVLKELTSKLEKYNPPSPDILFKDQDIDKFMDGLNKAIINAKSDDDATRIINNLNLYGYIIRLLAPGQSQYFDQNKGSLEFDIRVITPKPQVAEPTVQNLMPYIASFDKVSPVFSFTISPYQETNNAVEGRILNAQGGVAERLILTPMDQRPGSGVTPPVRGGTREYFATTTGILAPGKYTVEIIHKLSGKQAQGTAQLEIFKTGLTPESEKEIMNRMESYAYYGLNASLNAVTPAGGKIKADQFRIYVTTDQETQRSPVNSLTITPQNALELKPPAKKLNVKITWIQPITEKEVDIFAPPAFTIKQEEPGIILNKMLTDFSGTANKVKIEVRNIQIATPATGSDKDAKIDVKVVGDPQIVEGMTGYAASIEPVIDGDPTNGYTMQLEYTGKLERGQTKVKGTIRVTIQAVAINPINGERSEPKKTDIIIPVSYEPEARRQQRRR